MEERQKKEVKVGEGTLKATCGREAKLARTVEPGDDVLRR